MKLIKMFENHKVHHHKTAAALFFQSKKIFLPHFVVCLVSKLLKVGDTGGRSLVAAASPLSEAPGSEVASEGREARKQPEGRTSYP